MKKIIPFLFLSIILMPLLVSAQTPTSTTPPSSIDPSIDFPTNLDINIWQLLKRAARWLLNIVLLVGVIIIVWAGFSYVTAAGEPEKTKKALNMIIYSLIGIAIALLAYWIVNLILGFIGISTTVSPT